MKDSREDAEEEIRKEIRRGTKQGFEELMERLMSCFPDGESGRRFEESRTYILSNWTAARYRLAKVEGVVGSSTEGHVSHVLASRMSTKAMGWSLTGADKMAQLRAYYWNGGDLLELVRAERKTEELKIAEISINELVESNLRRVRPIAEQRNIDLVYESFREVRAQVDEVKLSLAITNLVENAIKYNHDNGWVHVSLNADHQYFFLKVEDNGVGIPEEDQDRIFDRFYRVDKARSRETGGTGLGLSITRNVILMHRGNLKVYSRPGEGTTFTMRIPLYNSGKGGTNG